MCAYSHKIFFKIKINFIKIRKGIEKLIKSKIILGGIAK